MNAYINTIKKSNIETIRAYISKNFLFETDDDVLNNDDSLLEEGIIDSTGVLELVDWLEEEFGLEIEDYELVPENLDSIDAITAFIERKKS